MSDLTAPPMTLETSPSSDRPGATPRGGGAALDAARGVATLPPTCEAWDVELEERDVVVALPPGSWRIEGGRPLAARRLREAEFAPFVAASGASDAGGVVDVAALADPPRPIVRPATPDGAYVEGEPLTLLLWPSLDTFHEIEILEIERGERTREVAQWGRLVRKHGLAPGRWRVRTRTLDIAALDRPRRWSRWSRPFDLVVHPESARAEARAQREAEHRLSCMFEFDAEGTPLLTDPLAVPPACPEDGAVRWFRTPCFDGAGVLVNERPEYYRDPLAYWLRAIDDLVARGFVFRTWHELLDDASPRSERELVLQFDLDAGPRSFARIHPELERRGIRANLMLHAEARDWYEWDLESLDLDAYRRLERAGWTIGYHNNALTRAQGLAHAGDESPARLEEAGRIFAADVARLRRHFDLRTFTHHGGLARNHRTPGTNHVYEGPDALGLVCVDRRMSPRLWSTIDRSFSDGGFTSRPEPFADRLAGFDRGRFFVRNHPVKYANFALPFDLPPIVADDVRRVGGEPDDALRAASAAALEKSIAWIEARLRHRAGQRVSHYEPRRVLSRGFAPREAVAERVDRLYARRRETHIRPAPWKWADPRVFWWRLLEACAPRRGKLLNIGALPPDRRDETFDFVGDEVEVIEMDIDPARRPHLLGDVTNPPAALSGTFDGVLLFGLTIIHSPRLAVDACRRLVRPGGVVLLGFAADTHPVRGGLWDPVHRPVWRPEREPLRGIGLDGLMWSFDPEAVRLLFAGWADVRAEFASDMWFVRATP